MLKMIVLSCSSGSYGWKERMDGKKGGEREREEKETNKMNYHTRWPHPKAMSFELLIHMGQS